jgi:probable rRNA maturation factor
MINLQVKRSIKLPVNKSILMNAAQLTLDVENAPAGSDISVVIGDNVLLKRLNLRYRKIDAATDVLSFPSSDPDPDTKSIYLGDIIISLPQAQEQASGGGHTLLDELQLLVVHGTLHLLGYDHLEQEEKRKMQAAQNIILNQLGVKLEITL